MAEITVIEKYPSLAANVKTLIIDGSGATSGTYDTDMDTFADAEFKEIHDAYTVSDTGAVKAQATYSQTTGIVTIGNLGLGGPQFKLFIVGK
jgi:hypothetical protein